jgi:hypothetical protein
LILLKSLRVDYFAGLSVIAARRLIHDDSVMKRQAGHGGATVPISS